MKIFHVAASRRSEPPRITAALERAQQAEPRENRAQRLTLVEPWGTVRKSDQTLIASTTSALTLLPYRPRLPPKPYS